MAVKRSAEQEKKIKEIRDELKRKYPDGYILDETEWLAMNPRRMAEEEGLDFDELREKILQRFSE